ncbi:MAG: hypothetical protein RR565_06585 [Erysipelothrix sp.]
MECFSKHKGTGNTWPEGDSQLKHIFGDRQGHIPDTPGNRTLLENLSNNMKNYLGVDQHGNQVFMQMLDDGSQIWSYVRDGVIRNGGMNIGENIRVWVEGIGLIVP